MFDVHFLVNHLFETTVFLLVAFQARSGADF
jgi:hypothetical protein